MFSILLSPTYFAPAQIAVLNHDGLLTEHRFDLKFKRLSQAAADSVLARAQEGALGYEEFFNEVLVGWRGVQTAGGEELPFTTDSLAQFLAIPGAAQSISRSYFASLTPKAAAWMAPASA